MMKCVLRTEIAQNETSAKKGGIIHRGPGGDITWKLTIPNHLQFPCHDDEQQCSTDIIR